MKKIKEYLLKDRTPFAEGLSFKKMFLIFVIFSFLGCLYEDILFMTKNCKDVERYRTLIEKLGLRK